jgi:tetratricopeptide (TPR) repeat protein
MKKAFSLLLATIILNLVQAQTLENGINQLQNENNIKAKQELLTVFNSNQSTTAAFYLGNAYIRLGDMDSAYHYFQKAELATDGFGYLAKARLAIMDNKDTNIVKTYINKALSVSKRKNPEIFFQAGLLTYQPQVTNIRQSIWYVNEAHGMDPGKIYYGLILGDMILESKEEGSGGVALSKYEEMLAKDPNNVLTNIRIGRLFYSSMNYEKAISYLEKANSINSGFSVAHKELGELYYLTRQYEKATAEYKKYIDLNNNDSRAKVTYSGFLFQLKEYQKAVDEINTFLAADSNNFIYHRILAYSYFEAKKPKEAQNALNKFWKNVPENKVTGMDYSYAGKIAGANGDTAGAIKFLKMAVDKDTTNADLQSEYAKAFFTAKRNKEAIEAYKKRLTMTSKGPGPLDYYYLGRAYYADADWVNADTTFADFVRLQPRSPDGYLWRAKSKLEMEDMKNLKGLSVPYYLKYIELASSDIARNKSNLVSAYNYLAYLALTQKDQCKAREYFSKILEIEPDDKNAKDELGKLKCNQ